MPNKASQEQFWKLYEGLSQELKDALFAEETGKNIYDVCDRNGALEKLREVVDYVGRVLVGILPPEDFQGTLESKLKLEKDVAKKIAQEINRFIFYPVRPALEEMYKTGPAKPTERKEKALISEEEPGEKKEEAEKPSGADTYREPIE